MKPIISINFITVLKVLWKIRRLWHKHILGNSNIDRKMGLIRDSKDERDILYKLRRPGLSATTTNRRNGKAFPWRYDQGQEGACVGHGVTEGFRRTLQVNGQPDFAPSRQFAYWIARIDKLKDTGASIRNAFKAINIYGLCSEITFPYVAGDFAKVPPKNAFDEALKHKSITYESVPLMQEYIQDAIYHGFPVVFGMEVYQSFMSSLTAETGLVPMPKKNCEKMMGGHCMAMFDYDEEGVWVLNSWGADWGLNGFCHITWKMVLDSSLFYDLWVFYKTE
jgi:hypothetical protein